MRVDGSERRARKQRNREGSQLMLASLGPNGGGVANALPPTPNHSMPLFWGQLVSLARLAESQKCDIPSGQTRTSSSGFRQEDRAQNGVGQQPLNGYQKDYQFV